MGETNYRVKLTFGLKEGKLIHISEVESGLLCECVCPACKKKLIAKKGNDKIHHFAHYNSLECANALETALHIMAKEILHRSKKILLPRVEVKFNSYKEPWVIFNEQMLEYDEVKIEKKTDNIVPDVLIYKKGRPLAIEITVTHQFGGFKISKYKELGISLLEIDLSKISRDFFIKDLEQSIVQESINKYWVHNVLSDNVYKNIIKLSDNKKTINRGLAVHVDNCPIKSRIWKGKPYANVIDDCIYCEYCVMYDSLIENIYCTGKLKISEYKDYLNYRKK